MLNKKKKQRLIFLLAYVILACAIVYFWRPVYLVSIVLVLVPPAVINFLWLKKSRFKILLFSVLTTLLFAPPVELAARLANAWDVQSILPRLFGIAPLENILFAFLNFFWVLAFYEYFVDKDRRGRISKRFRFIILGYILLFLVVFSIFFITPNLLAVNYALLALIILLVPGVIMFYFNPKLLKKIWLPTVFFALVFFIYEAVSLIVGSWWWPGEYILPINLVGNIFPLDDVIIWYFLSTPILIGGYEFFVDDNK
ncbi:MAG TPA: hypothetical protein VFD16_02400 [Candidatus Saccharimonadales bacterium]|nr:hypothetical protein [Candidatus Saccharimonadales bacterium]